VGGGGGGGWWGGGGGGGGGGGLVCVCSQNGDHLSQELAKFGYIQHLKSKKNLSILLYDF